MSPVPSTRTVLALVLAAAVVVPVRAAIASNLVVSILPLRDLVAELAGTDDVDVLVGAGATPALYEPTARQLSELRRAQALFVVGVPFETTFLPRVRRSMPELRIVDAAAGIERRELPEVAGHHGHDHAHDLDPHVWTDPRLVLHMIDTIATALVELDPSTADAVEARRQDLRARWSALDRELETALADVRPRVIAVFHPAFGYFAARYGFEQLAVESGGTDAGPRHLVGLAEQLRAHEVERLFVQPQFSPQRARSLASTLGVEVFEIDPLAPDVARMLRDLAAALGGSVAGAKR